MSARSYLSIGDVLTLLRQEFPDITISKIRFLESQGLVNPERTPSGYRKFYEHDVERLRWVLRQQREHFLPLKVIKDRLDDGSAEAEVGAGSATTPTRPGSAPVPTHAAAGEGDKNGSFPTEDGRVGDPVLVGQRVGAESESRAAPASAHPAGEAPLSLVGEGPLLPGLSDAGPEATPPTSDPPTSDRPAAPTSRAPSRPTPTTHRRGADRTPVLELVDDTVAAPTPGPPAAPASTVDVVHPAGSDPTAPSTTGAAPPATAATASAARRNRPAAARTESGEPARAPKGAEKPPATGASGPSSPPVPPPPAAKSTGSTSGGVSLSAEELAKASGLDLAVVRELQEYGLLVATSVAGVEYFDQEALTVATATAGLTRFGIEPRHLRLYKNAAEREAGFVEQVVLPLVRQRNPEARARAQETAEELTQLGQQLRGSLLRTALGNLLNG